MRKLSRTDKTAPEKPLTRSNKFPKRGGEPSSPILRGDKEAWELVLKNMRLLEVGARKHLLYARAPESSREDVKSIALVSLFQSAKRWDPEKGKYSTYAVSDMRRCRREIDKIRGAVHVHIGLRRKLADLLASAERNSRSLDEELCARKLRSTSIQAIIRAFYVTAAENTPSSGLRTFYSSKVISYAPENRNPRNRESLPSDSDVSLGPRQEDECFQKEMEGRVREALSTLSERQRDILEMRFGFNGYDVHTLDQVGKKYSLTRERIRLIQNEAFSRILESGHGPVMRELMDELYK